MLPRVGGPLAVALLVPVVWLGGAAALPSGLTAAALALALAVAVGSSSQMLRNARPAAEWLAATTAVGLAAAPVFVPLPEALRAALGDPRPGWLPLHGDVESGFPALVGLLSVGAFGALGALAGAQSVRRRDVVPFLAFACAIVVGIGLVHGLLGLRLQWGLIAPRHDPVRPFLPFVNPDHLGSLALLGLPAAVSTALDRRRTDGLRRLGVVAAAMLGVGVLASMSSAVIGIAALLGMVAVWRRGWRAPAVLGAVAISAVGAFAATLETSATARVAAWKAGLAAWADAPVMGVGLGAFPTAIEPHRTDRVAVVWGHAHGDPLEWVVETGVLGVVGALVASFLLRPRPLRDGSEPLPLDLGLAALLLHSTVDFPLHVPLLAGAAAVAWGVRRAVFEERRPASSRTLRSVLAVGAFALVAAAGSSYRTAGCEHALRALAAGDLRAAAELRAWGWQGPEADMAELLASVPDEASVQALVARWPDRADVWRAAAASHGRLGAWDRVAADLGRAEAAAPADWRNYAARGRLLAASGDGLAAAEAWRGAIAREAPWQVVEEAYRAFPVAVWWVDQLGTAPPHYAWALARAAMASEPDSALLALDLAERDRPGFYGPTRIEVLLVAGRYPQASAAAQDWLATHPEDAHTWAALGQARAGAGDAPGRIAAIERAAAILPDYRPRLIAALGESGATADAAERIRAWSLRGDVAPEVYLALAKSLADQDDQVGCRRALDGLRPFPTGPDAAAIRERCGLSTP